MVRITGGDPDCEHEGATLVEVQGDGSEVYVCGCGGKLVIEPDEAGR